ncbi:A-kinase anchor protein 13 [Xyrichtys novacula]|uniref:A-kinase anchor protein 13 n=1 Tax=Xyrichtys novacula TaxID=13765 RepID=A0AAV1F7D7_XYRNO|nr:A-kinase anchor protein 13 [Xyrichtys novacula]
MWTNSQHGPRTSTPRARHGDGLKQRNGAVIGDGVEELQGRRALKSADTQSHESGVMKLNPQQAPLYGECVLTVQLDDEEVCHTDREEEEEEAEFYLLFSGSTQRHLSSTLRVSQVTLQAVCPAHNVCEQVLVTLCVARPGEPVDAHSQETFSFVQDLALDMAHFLLHSTDPEEALLLEDQQIPLKECVKLDQSLALALKHLSPPTLRMASGRGPSHSDSDMDVHTRIGETLSHKDTETPEHTQRYRNTADTRVQQLCSLLNLAARHGLPAVASFVLQQPGGPEALRRTNAQGETATQEAERRGHKKLLELFKRYDLSSPVDAELQQQQQQLVYPEDRVFRHHADLGTYTLTLHQREEGAEPGSRERLQEEVEELRRLIHRRRENKESSGAASPSSPPACGLQACFNGQQGSRQDAVTIETCTTTTQGTPLTLEEATEREEPAAVSQTSCGAGSARQNQEAEGEVKESPAAGRSRKSRKKAARSKKLSPEDRNGTEQRIAKTSTSDEPVSPTGSTGTSVISQSGLSKTAEKTSSPREPETTTITEKQEAEKKREVDLLVSKGAAERQSETQTEERHAEGQTETQPGPVTDLRPAAESTVTMGQEQSQDPQATPSNPEGSPSTETMKPSPQSDSRTSPKSPDSERKPRRVLWRDGGWIGSRMGSPLNAQEEETKSVWYQGEDLEQGVGDSSESKDLNSQTVWYDCDSNDQREEEQLEQRGAKEKKEGDLSSAQLLEQDHSSHPPSAGLTQPHAAGSRPAPSHGQAAQRREVHASQREEEVEQESKEEGRSRKSSETAADNEETEAKNRKKKKKKRGKKGSTEAKLSSSSSIESQSQTEIQTEAETSLNPKDKDQTGRADTQREPTQREEAEQDAMTLPSQTRTQTQSRTTDSNRPECDFPNSDPGFTPPEISLTDNRRTDMSVETGLSEGTGLPAGSSPVMAETKEERADCHGPDTLTSDSSLLECIRPGSTEDSFHEEFPEQKTHLTVSVDSNKPGQSVDPGGSPAGFMGLESPAKAGGLPCCGTADVLPTLRREGRAETAGREYLEHCLASEMMSDQLQEEEGKTELREGDEEEGKERREEGKENGMVHEEKESLQQKFSKELAAAAVAVVTVAVASAIASIELSQQSEKEQSARREISAQDAEQTEKTQTEQMEKTEQTHQTCPEQMKQTEWTQTEQTRTEQMKQTEQTHTEQTEQTCIEQTHTEQSEKKDTTEQKEQTQQTHTEQKEQTQQTHTEQTQGTEQTQHQAETQILEKLSCDSEAEEQRAVQTEPLREDRPTQGTDGRPVAAVSTLPADQKPLSESEDEAKTDLQLQIASPPPSPVSDTGQPEDSHLSCLDSGDSRDLRSQPVHQREGEKQAESEPTQTDDRHGVIPAGEQIQRDRDVFCPVQPLPEANTVTCTDVLPETDECVSLCLMRSDKDSLDDSVFKKPADPPLKVGQRDRGVRVSWSSTDEACPSEGGLSVGSADSATPRSSRLSWKSETEDRGGGGGGGGGGDSERGGEEEEKNDRLTENPVSSAIMRASIRSLSPLRRHSWEPTPNVAESDITASSSVESPPEETKRVKTPLHRRSMSWCPSNLHPPDQQHIDSRSYSLEGLEERGTLQTPCPSILSDQQERSAGRREERGSLLSLTEEEQEGDTSSLHSQPSHQTLTVTNSCPPMFHHQSLTKSISMVAISHRDLSGGGSFSSNSGSLEYSISEEEPGPLRSDTEGKGGPKISRTFSYLRNKMTKKGKEKEKRGEREREGKEKEKKSSNGHLFISISPSPSSVCQLCSKPLKDSKDSFICNNCGVYVHKCCRESLPVCAKSKTKMQTLGPEAAPGSAVNTRSKSTSSASSVSSTSSSSSRERWSTATTPDDQLPVLFPRRHPSIFNTHSNLSKSISTSNIAGLDEVPLKGLKFLSQSTDSLNQGSKVNASTESLTDEGTEMIDSQLMGEFECEVKDLEADSWSATVDKKFLKALKKDEIKRQDVIYELYQTEFHHVRTLRIMSEVYYKGLQKELQLDTLTMDKIFPMLDDLLDMHMLFFSQLLERKRASSSEGQSNNNFLICSVGDILLQQFSGCSADRMKKVYGKFCSRHNEAVNLYKDLYAKDKRFQASIKRMMSSSIVRRLGIPECILLVTQRITKYPVLLQRILQHTKESDEDHSRVCEALRCVKELISAVDSKVNEQEKKQRLREVYSRTDSKSIMRMKSGQMFAKEDLVRGRKLLHDGALQLKNSAGRLKDVQAMLLSDVLVFLQEKDTKYVFASLDQRSTVISLQNLIVREVANEERGLFLITAGIERPEMVEVLASSKEERNTWRAIIQDAMHCMEKDEDEGVPSETEEDRRQQESRAKEIRELLRQKDEQIISLLVEKVHIFRDLSDCSPAPDDRTPPVRERMLFRATADDVTKGEPIIKDALREVEMLHTVVHSGVGGAGCSTPVSLTGGSVGPVCLPRRAETFGGFDSHQMNSSKNGEKEEGDESLDLRRTESDSVLKKGAAASLQMLLKRNNEQVQHGVTHLHDLLLSLQAVVVQQDSFIEDQRQAMSDRLTANSSRHSSSSSLSSSSSSRPSSLIEQEKHRSLERQRQEAASLQKQQAAHQEEKRRREKTWELKERSLTEREERLRMEEEETGRRRQELLEERETLQRKKEEYQKELERLREAQRKLERDKEALRRDTERLEAMKREEVRRYKRTPSTTSEDSIRFHSSGSLDLDSKEAEEPKEVELSSSAPTKEPFLRIGSKRMGKNFNPFSSSSSSSSKAQGAEKESQLPSRLLQLTKPKEKKDKKKKKGKDSENKVTPDPQNDGDIYFC